MTPYIEVTIYNWLTEIKHCKKTPTISNTWYIIFSDMIFPFFMRLYYAEEYQNISFEVFFFFTIKVAERV